MKVETEIWQVFCQGEIFQADLATLKQWIVEGAVGPTDKVRKGNFNWIEAGRVPLLRGTFSGEDGNAPTVEATPELPPKQPPDATIHAVDASLTARLAPDAFETQSPPNHAPPSQPSPNTVCYFHAGQPPEFICRICGNTFCRTCPNFVGTSRIPLCPLCGDLCKPIEEVRKRNAHLQFRDSGFGIEDFGQALAYPFRHIISLICGAAFYGLLLLAGIRGHLFALALMFGCIALVINRVAYGELNRDFIPDFSAFDLWDDVVVPLFLGLGVSIVTLAPTVVLLLALFFGWFGSPPPPVLGPTPAPQAAEQAPLKDGDFEALAKGDDPAKEAEVARKIDQLHPAHQITEQAEKAQKEPGLVMTVFNQLVAHPGLILLLGLLAIGWAVFYYPMALTVAGYTEDFKSVINPLVGIDLIRRMGLVYLKAFGMYLVVEIVGSGISLVVTVITAPFSLSFVGNLPAAFINGMLSFYINLVIACLLGLALFKSAERVGLAVD